MSIAVLIALAALVGVVIVASLVIGVGWLILNRHSGRNQNDRHDSD